MSLPSSRPETPAATAPSVTAWWSRPPTAAMPAPPPAPAPAGAAPQMLMRKAAVRPGVPAGEEAAPAASAAEINLKPWDSQAPYIAELRKAAPETRYQAYLGLRKEHGQAAGFYLDCADLFFAQKQEYLSLRVLSNIAEQRLEDPALLRVLAHRLAQQGLLELARLTFEEVRRLRPEEP